MIDPATPPKSSTPAGGFEYRRVAYAAAWIVCLMYAGQRMHHARTEFDNWSNDSPEKHRADGNDGHAQIDFGGQWVMGRMVATGHARDLYDRREQWKVVREGFPRSAESNYVRKNAFPASLRDPSIKPEDVRHDDDAMMWWFMGTDPPQWDEAGAAVALPVLADPFSPSALTAVAPLAVSVDRLSPELIAAVDRKTIGGPLYPPVHGFLYAPLGLLDPQPAYIVFQLGSFALTFLAGLGVCRMTRGRVWWPVATVVILLWPGYRGGLDLGQNQVLSLTILVWGWVLATRGRDGWGGVVWGLLAFKPVWAAAFFLVPLLMGRWRFCATMAVTGLASIVATLPFTGVQPWLDWLAVGREASDLYLVNKNWVHLSRDVSGIPRRFLIDFTVPESERGGRIADLASWACLFSVLAMTIGVYLGRGRREYCTGLGTGFLILGAYLGCYRFMYYDTVLAVLPVAVLLARPGWLVRPTVRWVPIALLALLLAVDNLLIHWHLQATFAVGRWAVPTHDAAGVTSYATPTVSMATSVEYPWDTVFLLMLWMWCGWRLIREGDRGEPEAATDHNPSALSRDPT